jgi:hypothetical protein
MAKWLAVVFTILVVGVAFTPIVRLIRAWYRKQAREKQNKNQLKP